LALRLVEQIDVVRASVDLPGEPVARHLDRAVDGGVLRDRTRA
jgi:hypothetical protein